MKGAKPVEVLLGSHLKLRKDGLSKTEMEDMTNVSYAYAVGEVHSNYVYVLEVINLF